MVTWNNSLVLRIYLLRLPRKSERSVKLTRDYRSVLVVYHHELDYKAKTTGETIGNIGQTTGKTIGDIGQTVGNIIGNTG